VVVLVAQGDATGAGCGFRCLAPDLVGFGRSDKPATIDFYSYDRHVEMTGTLLEISTYAKPRWWCRLGRPDRAATRGRASRAGWTVS